MLLFNYSEESEREACYKDNEERGDAMKYLLTKCEDGGINGRCRTVCIASMLLDEMLAGLQ